MVNGWRIITTDYWLFDNVNETLVHGFESGGVDYLEKVFVLAHSERTGLVAIDTHPERYGWISYFWYEISLDYGGFPVVAHSFREWLERTIAAGPDEIYWQNENFQDLGPALPGDPNYHGPGAR